MSPTLISPVSRDLIFLYFALEEVSKALGALDDVDRLSELRDESRPGITVLENHSILSAIRCALHFTGSASRIFWPVRDKAKARGARMRALTALPDEHPFRDRTLRNTVEHLDERLDVWTAESPRPFTTVQMVLHDDDPYIRHQASESILMTYQVAHKRVSVLGESFDLNELRKILLDVQQRISVALQNYTGETRSTERKQC